MLQKLTEQFAVPGVPGVDTTVLVEAQRKNMETLTAANRAAYEGAQAIAQRQAEILREAASEAVKATRELTAEDVKFTYDIFLNGLHPDDREKTDQAVQRSFDPDGPGNYDVEYRVIGLTDGTERWIAATGASPCA